MKRRIYLFIFFCLTCTFAWTQARQVTGRVTKENTNQSISSVTVRVKGGTTVTTSDTSGNFTISVPNNNSVLEFSSVGFSNTEVAVGSAALSYSYRHGFFFG
jgi:hypothetical protein